MEQVTGSGQGLAVNPLLDYVKKTAEFMSVRLTDEQLAECVALTENGPRAVNTYLFGIMSGMNRPAQKLSDAQKKSIIDELGPYEDSKLNELEQAVNYAENNLKSAHSSVESYTRKLFEARLERERYDGKPPSFWRKVEDILQRTNLTFESAAGQWVYFVTENIVMNLIASDATSPSINLGKFCIGLRYDGVIKVYEHENNIKVGSHYHPHVAADGAICWGDVGALYKESQLTKNPAAVFPALLGLLQTYNPNSPYKTLLAFKCRELAGRGVDLNALPAGDATYVGISGANIYFGDDAEDEVNELMGDGEGVVEYSVTDSDSSTYYDEGYIHCLEYKRFRLQRNVAIDGWSIDIENNGTIYIKNAAGEYIEQSVLREIDGVTW